MASFQKVYHILPTLQDNREFSDGRNIMSQVMVAVRSEWEKSQKKNNNNARYKDNTAMWARNS